MIHINVTTHQNNIVNVEISGHAESGEYGKDLVCAGVSTVVTGVCNTLALHHFLDQGTIKFENGYVHIYSNVIQDDYQLILETLIVTLECMEENYGQYIKINKQEE